MNIDSRYVMTMSNFHQCKYQEVSALRRFGCRYHLPGCLICGTEKESSGKGRNNYY